MIETQDKAILFISGLLCVISGLLCVISGLLLEILDALRRGDDSETGVETLEPLE